MISHFLRLKFKINPEASEKRAGKIFDAKVGSFKSKVVSSANYAITTDIPKPFNG